MPIRKIDVGFLSIICCLELQPEKHSARLRPKLLTTTRIVSQEKFRAFIMRLALLEERCKRGSARLTVCVQARAHAPIFLCRTTTVDGKDSNGARVSFPFFHPHSLKEVREMSATANYIIADIGLAARKSALPKRKCLV